VKKRLFVYYGEQGSEDHRVVNMAAKFLDEIMIVSVDDPVAIEKQGI
jgi:hypothetical protein